jgi:hypothetical protein
MIEGIARRLHERSDEDPQREISTPSTAIHWSKAPECRPQSVAGEGAEAKKGSYAGRGSGHIDWVNETEVNAAWRRDGFVILPGYLSEFELAPALSELGLVFPTADGFHDATDPRHERYRSDEFDGIDLFPFASTELSLLAVAPRLVKLADWLLGEGNLRLYSAQAWAKYTGATNYDQDLHRDYLNHTVLVPTTAQRHRQLEMFVFLNKRSRGTGPTALGLTATHSRPTGKSQLLPPPRRAGSIRGRRRSC